MALDVIVDWQEFKMEVQGQEVSMMIRPLRTDALLTITPIMSDETMLDMERMVQAQKAAINFIDEHVKDISGLTVNGKTVNASQLCGESLFRNESAKIIAELISISTLSEVESGNSEGPSTSQETDEQIEQ
jgi:hypothetical protein